MRNSITLYLETLGTPALPVLDAEESFEWGKDLIKSEFKPAHNPVFMVDIQMNEQQAYYSTNPEEFTVSASLDCVDLSVRPGRSL